jgi:hypothetical protein
MTVTLMQTKWRQPITFFTEHIFAVTYLPEMKSVVVVGPGNAHQPVEGTLEEVVESIKQAKLKGNDAPIKGGQ